MDHRLEIPEKVSENEKDEIQSDHEIVKIKIKKNLKKKKKKEHEFCNQSFIGVKQWREKSLEYPLGIS